MLREKACFVKVPPNLSGVGWLDGRYGGGTRSVKFDESLRVMGETGADLVARCCFAEQNYTFKMFNIYF